MIPAACTRLPPTRGTIRSQARAVLSTSVKCLHSRRTIMKRKAISSILLTALCLLGSVAWASTRYVNGVSGSDSNNCTSAITACKTIGHAISLASSGDSIIVAAATYSERLAIGKNLNILGSGAPTTIIDGGGGVGTVVNIS